MIPLQISDKERAALLTMKPAIEEALYKAGIELEIPEEFTGIKGFYDHNLKVNKIAYNVIERFDLPLLRTWFKYGQWEPYDELRPKTMSVGENAEKAYLVSGIKLAHTQEDIVNYLIEEDVGAIFEKEKFEFLVENYRRWNPQPFTDAYIASTKLIQILEGIEENDEEWIINNSGQLRDEFKEASLDLRYELDEVAHFDDELAEHADGYLRLLEDAIISVEETSEISEDQLDTLKESREVYHEYVWHWAALNISVNMAEGPDDREKDFKKKGHRRLQNKKGSFETHLKGWQTSIHEDELDFGVGRHQTLGQTTPEALKKLQQAAIEPN